MGSPVLRAPATGGVLGRWSYRRAFVQQRRTAHSQQVDRFVAAGDAVRRAVGFAPAASSLKSHWNSAALFSWRGVCGEAAFEALPDPALVLHTAGAPSVPVRAHNSWNQRSHPGLLTIIPPGTPITWNVRGEVHSFSVHLHSRLFETLTDQPARSPAEQIRFCCGVSEPFLAASIRELADELHHPSQKGSLYADSICDVIAMRLMRRGQADACEPGGPARLGRAHLRRTLDLLESRLEGGISLAELARNVGLSRSYFATAFRDTVGVAPHRYLVQRRLERAEEFLRASDRPLAEIAVLCGFSSQAHFTHLFRRAYGITPLRYRRG